MSTVKKAYQDVIAFLEQNKDKKVATILDDVTAMCAAKAGGGGRSAVNVARNAAGEVTHIFCWYHKRWEKVGTGEGECEFGKKASNPTGYNNMCKEGTSSWSKQQRDAKTAREDLLTKVASGDVKPEEIPKRMEKIEKDRTKIIPREDGLGSTEAPEGVAKPAGDSKDKAA